MNDVTPLRPSISSSPQASALAVEVAKILKLVAPVSMDDHAQVAWIATAVDALEDIRASEVAAISAELRRSITRHNQIVPEIAKMVAQRRSRTVSTGSMDAINADRVRQGLGAIQWVNGKCEFVDPPRSSIGERAK